MKNVRSRRQRVVASQTRSESLEQRTLLAAAIKSVQIDNQAPVVLPELNSQTLLALSDSDSTRLFTTDGTQGGTVQFADIPALISDDVSGHAIMGTSLYFALQGAKEPELWKTDGTSDGTVLIKKGINETFDDFAELNNELYFTAQGDGFQGYELFKTDGTPDGTVIVKDIYPGLRESNVSVPVGGGTFELWINEVDENGRTIQPRVVYLAGVQSSRSSYEVTVPEGRYFYWTRLTTHDNETLDWSSRRTLNASGRAYSSEPSGLTTFNGEIYFAATNEENGRELWKSNGTESGTTMVLDINPGFSTFYNADDSDPQNLVEFDGSLFFSADTDESHHTRDWSLYRTNGTADGTIPVSGEIDAPLAVVNNRLIAVDNDDPDRLKLVAFPTADSTTPEVLLDTPKSTPVELTNYSDTIQSPIFLQSFAVVEDRLTFTKFEYDSHVEFTYPPYLWRGAPGGYLNRYTTTSAGTHYASDGTVAGTTTVAGDPVEFVFVEPSFPARIPSTKPSVISPEIIDGGAIVDDHGVWRKDGQSATLIVEAGASGGLIADAFGVANGESLVKVDGSGQRQVLDVPLTNATELNRIGQDLFITADSGSGRALFRLDESETPIHGPRITSPESNQSLPNGRVNIDWDPVVSANDYDVEVHLIIDGVVAANAVVVQRTTATSFSYDLVPNNYRVRVRANLNDGAVSTWIERTFVVLQPVGGPTILSPSRNELFRSSTISASWVAQPNAESYEIRINASEDDAPADVTGIATASTSFEVPPGYHRVEVRTRFADGSLSDWTEQKFVAVPPIKTLIVVQDNQQPRKPLVFTGNIEPHSAFIRTRLTIYDADTREVVTGWNSSSSEGQLSHNMTLPGSGRYRLTAQHQLFAREGSVSQGVFYGDEKTVLFDAVVPFGSRQPNELSALETDTQLDAVWSSVNEAQSYQVRIYGFAGGQQQEIRFITDVTDTRHVIDIPDGYTSFSMEVRAVHADGTVSEWTRRTSYVPLSTLRESLRLTRGTGLHSDTTPTISWETPTRRNLTFTRYELLIHGENGSYRRTRLQSETHELESALPDGTYDIYLRAHFAEGIQTSWAYPAGTITIESNRAEPPEILSPRKLVTDGSLIFEWASREDTDTYELWVSSATEVTAIIHETGLTQDSHSPASQLGPGKYRLWVRRHHADGTKSRWSATYRFEILQEVVMAIGGVGRQTTTRPTITWDPRDNVVRYDLYINESGVSSAAYRRTHLTESSHTLEEDLTNGKTYEVWVRAHYSDGTRSRWGAAGVKLIIGDEGSIDITQYQPALTITGNLATWSSVPGALRYQIWVNNPGVSPQVFVQDWILETEIEIPLRSGTYRAWLIAHDANGNASQWSAAVDFTIADAAASAILELVPSERVESELLLTLLTPDKKKESDSHSGTVIPAANIPQPQPQPQKQNERQTATDPDTELNPAEVWETAMADLAEQGWLLQDQS